MAAGLLIFPGAFPSRAWNNADRTAAQIAFYENGAPGTPKTVYADVGLTTPLANPVHSDAYGNFPAIYGDIAELYTAVWSTEDGQSKTLDDLSASTAANQTALDQTVAARDQALAYRDEASGFADDAEDAKNAAEALYGDLTAVQAAVTASEAARDLSEDYRDQAETFKNTAQGAAATATAQAEISTTKAGEAAASSGQAKGYVGGAPFLFSTITTDSDPGNGSLRISAAEDFLYVDNLDADGASAAWMDIVDDSTSPTKGQIFLRDGLTGALAVFTVSGAVVVATGYRKIPVIKVGSSGAFANGARIGLAFAATGNQTSTTPTGYNPQTGNYTVQVTDWGKTVDITANSPTISFAAAGTLGNGFWCRVKVSGSGTATLPTIDGQARQLTQGEAALIQSDGTNLHWTWINADPGPHVHVRDEKIQGTNGGTGSGVVTRDLNTVLRNTIGAVLASNKLTLPPGSYHVEASAPGAFANGHFIRLYNETDATVIGRGPNAYEQSGNTSQSPALLSLDFVLTAAKVVRLEHYVSTSTGGNLGFSVNLGAEVYAELKVWKRPQ